jgi:hypothetical protein
MNNLNKLAEELYQLTTQKKELETKEEVLKGMLLIEMGKAKKDKESFDFGTISVGHRRTYIYSEVVKKLEDKVKIKKDEEVKQGVAEEKVTEYLTLRTK